MSHLDRFEADPVDLSEFEDDFTRTASPAARESHRDQIPDGPYDARVEDVTLSRVQSTGNPMLIWRLRILGPTHRGASISKVRIITHKTVDFLKEDLSKLGLEMGSLKEMTSRLDEMVDRPIGIIKKVRPDKGWTDVYFVKPRPELAAQVIPPEIPQDDDLPF